MEKERGSSFTESLITIVVAGVACVAFISVVASIVRETKNREIKELMTNYSFDGLSKTRLINSYGLPNVLEAGINYEYKIDDDELVLFEDISSVDCTGEGSECELLDLNVEGDEFFYRKVSLRLETTSGNGVAKVTVEVGRVNPTGVEDLDKFSIDGFIQVL